MMIPCRVRTPQAHDVRQLPSQGAKKELPLSASLSREKKYESQGTILPVRGGGPRSGGVVAKPSNEYQILLLKPDNFSLTKGGGLINS